MADLKKKLQRRDDFFLVDVRNPVEVESTGLIDSRARNIPRE